MQDNPIATLREALHREILNALRSAVPSTIAFCYTSAADGGELSGSLLKQDRVLPLPGKPLEELLQGSHEDLAAHASEHCLLVRFTSNVNGSERCLGIGGVALAGDRRCRQAALVALNQIAPLLSSLVASHQQCVELTRRALALQALIVQQQHNSIEQENTRAQQFKNEGLLSHRELQIARLLVSGYAAINAAAVLHLSEHTVRTYIRRMYRKLEVSNRADLVRTLVSPNYNAMA